jgi:hypothetical protein
MSRIVVSIAGDLIHVDASNPEPVPDMPGFVKVRVHDGETMCGNRLTGCFLQLPLKALIPEEMN